MNKRNFLLLIGFCLVVVFMTSISAVLNVSLSDQGTNVTDKSTGLRLSTGNLTIEIHDSLVGGNLIHNETFVGAITGGAWNVMIGENTSNPLQLEFGKIYYKDYAINYKDLNFTDYQGNAVGRKFFYSPLGDIGGEDINKSANLTISGLNVTGNVTVSGNVSASWFRGLFDWIINAIGPSSNYLSFNGSDLTFSETYLNATIGTEGNRLFNTTAGIQNLINSTGIYSTYNATYDNYKTNVSRNWTLNAYNNWNDDWLSTYNATYVAINTTANIQGLLNSTGIYSTPLTINTTANIQNLINSTGIYSTFNATYDNYATNVSRNYTLQTYTNWNTAWLSTYNATYVAINTTANIQGLLNGTSMNFANVGIGTTLPTEKLNVIGNANITGNLTLGAGKIGFNDTSHEYIYHNTTQWKPLVDSDAYYRTYDTGWVSNNDWTNQHLGTAVGGNVVHNLGAALSELDVKVLISTDGTDANSFETLVHMTRWSDVGSLSNYGVTVYQVDSNNIVVQTGVTGLSAMNNSNGELVEISTNDWYYKIKVSRIVRLDTTPLFGGTPAGAIMAFYTATCPDGWIIADGTSGTPDLRGIFVRGAGTSGAYNMSNGTRFNQAYGTFQNDSFQSFKV